MINNRIPLRLALRSRILSENLENQPDLKALKYLENFEGEKNLAFALNLAVGDHR